MLGQGRGKSPRGGVGAMLVLSLACALCCGPVPCASLSVGRRARRASVAAQRALETESGSVNNLGVYVGSGYDVYLGNPLVNGVDPGFRASIFDLNSYEEGKTTSDGRFHVPDGAELKQCAACETDMSVDTMSSMESYSHELGVKVELSASYKGVAFSGSVGYNKAKQKMSTEDKSLVEAKAECCVFMVHLTRFDRPYFTANFENVVAEMSELTEMSEDEREEFWADFFKEFGTHVVLTAEMGGRHGRREFLSKSEMSKMESEGISWSAEIGYKAKGGAEAKVGVSQERNTEKKEAQATADENAEVFAVGGVYSPNKEQWMENVREEPMPIGLPSLKTLDWLFVPRMFPADPNIARKQTHVKLALNEYCYTLQRKGKLERCTPLAPMDKDAPEGQIFRGMFFRSDDSEHDVPNPWTDALTCPLGSIPQKLARVSRGDGAKGWLEWCMRKDATAELVNKEKAPFGGLFASLSSRSSASGGSQSGPNEEDPGLVRPNPVTRARSCPENYEETRIYVAHVPDTERFFVASCFRTHRTQVDPREQDFGGIYALPKDPSQARLRSANPVTGSPLCPAGFTQHLIGKRVHAGEDKEVDIFVCKSDLYGKEEAQVV